MHTGGTRSRIAPDLGIFNTYIRGNNTHVVAVGCAKRNIMHINFTIIRIDVGGSALHDLGICDLKIRRILVANGDSVAAEHYRSADKGGLAIMFVQNTLILIFHNGATGNLQCTAVDDTAVLIHEDLAIRHGHGAGIFDRMIAGLGDIGIVQLQCAGLGDLHRGIGCTGNGHAVNHSAAMKVQASCAGTGQHGRIGSNGDFCAFGDKNAVTNTVLVTATVPCKGAAGHDQNIVVSAGNNTAILGQSALIGDSGMLRATAGNSAAGNGSIALIQDIVSQSFRKGAALHLEHTFHQSICCFSRGICNNSIFFQRPSCAIGNMDTTHNAVGVHGNRAFHCQAGTGGDYDHVLPCPVFRDCVDRAFTKQNLVAGNLNRRFQHKIILHGDLRNRGIRHLVTEALLGKPFLGSQFVTSAGTKRYGKKRHQQTDQDCSQYAIVLENMHFHHKQSSFIGLSGILISCHGKP